MRAASALARRTFAASRVLTGSFAALFALMAYVNVVGYRHSYPTLRERIAFARSFGANKAVELFYGAPHELLTVGGYTAWRVGGFGAIVAGYWGAHATVRALRGEEDAGRRELELAGALGRGTAYLAGLAGVAAAGAVLWLALFAAFALARLPAGASAFLALATLTPAVVFAGVGALASQLGPTRRIALELALGALAAAFLLRVVADTSTALSSLRWVTPLGWAEELRPFATPRYRLLPVPLAAGAILAVAAGRIARHRDVGTGLLAGRDTSAPRDRLLGSPTALAFRESRGTLIAWSGGIGLFAVVVGLLSTSFNDTNLSPRLREELKKLGGVSLTSPAGALAFYFLLFVFLIALYVCSTVASARHEESDQRLETTFALPVSRRRWLAGRLVLGAAGAGALALVAALGAWAGARVEHADVSLLRLLEAGVNCLPASLLFLAAGLLAFAALPRASVGLAYGLVTAMFLWQLFGSLLGAPHWLEQLTPFGHIGLVPAEPFRPLAALVMLAIAGGAALAAILLFERRDLTGA